MLTLINRESMNSWLINNDDVIGLRFSIVVLRVGEKAVFTDENGDPLATSPVQNISISENELIVQTQNSVYTFKIEPSDLGQIDVSFSPIPVKVNVNYSPVSVEVILGNESEEENTGITSR